MAPQNTKVSRETHGRFAKGVSGNPGGRPAGVRAEVQKRFGKNGAKAIEAFALIALADAAKITKFFGGTPYVPTLRERMEALRELLDRGFGRAVQTFETPDGDGLPKVAYIVHQQAPATR